MSKKNWIGAMAMGIEAVKCYCAETQRRQETLSCAGA
jgi:hypothetical protein